MKQRLKAVSYALVLTLLFSAAMAGGPMLGPFGVDVVSAASEWTEPAPTPAPTPKPVPKPSPTSNSTPAAIGSRLLVEGSFGADVKLLQEKLNANGFNLGVDGFFGPKTLNALKGYQSKNALIADGIFGPKTNAKLNAEVTAPVEPTVPATPVESTELKIGRVDYAAHGTKCFTSAVVAMVGDKIVGASIDDYQFISTDVATGVPNSDADFGANYKDPSVVLASKRVNTHYYSEHMAEEAGSTVAVDKNFDAIQSYVVGKTVAELESTLSTNSKDQMVDAVSSATLVDTYGYVSAIVEATKAARVNSSVTVDTATVANIEMKRVDYAAHGTKCFTSAVAVMSGDKILGASLNDYQFISTDVATGVPNSDADFGANYKDPSVVLASKRVNTHYYSEHMAEEAGSTVSIDKNFDAIESYVAGKTVSELESTLSTNSKDQMVDVVSSATLADTYGYVSAVVAAAKGEQAKPTTPVNSTALKIGRVDYAAHGTKCFTSAVVAMVGDKIVGASIDDYQFMSTDVAVGVPNSDADFGANYKDPSVVLASKRVNTHYYSEHMAEEAGSTVAVDKNYDAIEEYVVGKTVAELEATLSSNSKEQMVDVVSSATLVDTSGYVSAIVEAAKASKVDSSITVDADTAANIEMKRVDYAAHGTKCFTSAVVVMSGDKILGASLNDYQFISTDVAVGVPNSDADFGANFKDPSVVLASKRVNTHYYSEHMAEEAGSTVSIDKNFNAIQAFVAGKTVAELEATLASNSKEQMVDVVSSATLVDTYGYVSAIVAAAKSDEVPEVDVVSTASLVVEGTAFENALSEDGTWIICPLNDLTIENALVLEGAFYDKDDPAKDLKRKIGLYTQDADHNLTGRFTLTAPSLTIKSPYATLQKGIFVGDIYVEANNFSLVDQTVNGNVYFTTQEAKDTFVMDETSSISGVQELK